MTWLPDVVGLGILALCGGAFWLCRRERLTIKGLLDRFKEGPPADKTGERHWGVNGK